mgnify:CR=1 FL=1
MINYIKENHLFIILIIFLFIIIINQRETIELKEETNVLLRYIENK